MHTVYDTKLSSYSPNKDLHFLLGHTILHFPPGCFHDAAIVSSLAQDYNRNYKSSEKFKSYKFRYKNR
ncbi:hypothetical protein [Desulfuribacillus alkaliarsenatis]|uniref:Uncharacterized protein n=1 Tax=Desulfuribacillus alkaliarsenatis TaxID=766136 RepID=A0A1E5G546_9FIRM|nr:hypothetical protein [Desulfuribacillus alkaliarsenatis]OEF98307.1 hypothetical protein BHF68_01100 [Desulfuribacillus alkaliarsenatis]